MVGPPGPCGCGCALTPGTSYGFAVEVFARDVVEQPLDPWQRWAAIHAGELLLDGRPRFRRVLLLVARQNGKTQLVKILILFWLFVQRCRRILGTSTNLQYAREAWFDALKVVHEEQGHEEWLVPELAELVPVNLIRRTNGQEAITTRDGCWYGIAAKTRRGGRSLPIDRLVADELREQQTWSAYNAAYNAMNARPFGQAFFVTNQGDETSVVLNALHAEATRYLDTGDGDGRLGLLEWSGPDGCACDDPEAIAAANPNVGHRNDWDTLLAAGRSAARNGGQEETGYRTEVLCQRVRTMNPAIDAAGWAAGAPRPDREFPDLARSRSRLALCFDVSLDGLHASVYVAAVLPDGTVAVDPVKAWDGPRATTALRGELPALTTRIRPRRVGWFPSGPAAAVAADLGERRQRGWPPAGITIDEIRSETTAVCMGFAEIVRAGQVLHPDDPLLNAQVAGAEKAKRGDAWVFTRAGGGHQDAVYAAAGAVHLARTMPAPLTFEGVIEVPRS